MGCMGSLILFMGRDRLGKPGAWEADIYIEKKNILFIPGSHVTQCVKKLMRPKGLRHALRHRQSVARTHVAKRLDISMP